MRSDEAIGCEENQGAESLPTTNASFRRHSAWRLTQQQLRELATPRPRDYHGEVVWRVHVD